MHTFALILLAIPGIITTNFSFDGSGYTMAAITNVGSLKFNGLSFLILIFYLLINRKSVAKLMKRTFYGSTEDIQRRHEKEIQFYYKQFTGNSGDELKVCYNMFSQYPITAQSALKQIHQERGFS